MRKGQHCSPETIQRMREANLGSKNPMFGKKISEEHKQIIREATLGSKNNNWKGDKISNYSSIHGWMLRNKPKPDRCEHCGLITDDLDWAYEDHHALQNNIPYKRDPNLFHALCSKCHTTLDGRLEKMRIARIGSHHSLESKLKMSNAKQGSNHWNWGKHFRPETIRKMSEARKLYYHEHPEAIQKSVKKMHEARAKKYGT